MKIVIPTEAPQKMGLTGPVAIPQGGTPRTDPAMDT